MPAKTWVPVLLLIVAGCNAKPAPPPVTGQDFLENFETHDPLPTGWESKAGEWIIVDAANATSGEHTLQQNARARDAFPHVIASGRGTYGDLEASVRIRLLAGTASQSGGIAFRYVDANNYYVARLNALEQNVRFFEYSKGAREKYPEAFNRTFPLNQWFTFAIHAVGDNLTVTVDGVEAFRVEDDTLAVGHLGLWVKDDAVTQFDDFRVERL